MNSLNSLNEEVSEVTQKPSKKPEFSKRHHFLRYFFVVAMLAIVGGFATYLIVQNYFVTVGSLKVLSVQQAQLQETVHQQSQLIENNQTTIQRLHKLMTNATGSVWVFKAGYLIRQAQLTLEMQRNVPLTITLLKSADRQLHHINNPQALKLRSILAKNITLLQDLPDVDIVGLYFHLKALGVQIAQLPLISTDLIKKNAKKDESKDHSIWMRGLTNSWHAITRVLVIRDRSDSVHPLISSEQRYYLNLNMQILFAQAQWALLQRQQEIYSDSLQQIMVLVKRYFSQTSPQVKKILDSLKALQKTTLSLKLPDISDSLNVAKRLEHSAVELHHQIVKDVEKS